MKSVPILVGKLVSIKWKDSNFAPGWNNCHRITASIPEVKSIGWVTFCDKAILELANHIGEEGARLNPTSIPWRSIIEVKQLGD